MSRRVVITGFLRKACTLALLLAALLLVNDLASRLPLQADLTGERFFTLSEGTVRMLEEMKTPVQVELYFSSSCKEAADRPKSFRPARRTTAAPV